MKHVHLCSMNNSQQLLINAENSFVAAHKQRLKNFLKLHYTLNINLRMYIRCVVRHPDIICIGQQVIPQNMAASSPTQTAIHRIGQGGLISQFAKDSLDF